MIELSGNTILVMDASGRSVPFDSDLLRGRVERACSGAGTPDPELAAEIALAVEWTLRARAAETAVPVRQVEIDLMTVRILENAACGAAADIYRSEADAGTAGFLVEISRIHAFLEQQFPDAGQSLERVAKKVLHTLKSIGADTSAPALVLELGRHFLYTETEQGRELMPPPVFRSREDALTLSRQDVEEFLHSENALSLLRRRVISIHPADLRVFPVLRFDLRLSGFAGELAPPLTELALSPALVRAADAMDAIALAADAACAKKGHGDDTPLKTAVHFSDASVFTRDFMGCADMKSGERCAASLAQILRSMLARIPMRFSCQ